jgi:hypothetical protein
MNYYALPLKVDEQDFTSRMEEIAEELDELHEEVYEVQRFLANLTTFEIPPKEYRKILGTTLYREVGDLVEECFKYAEDEWTENEQYSLDSFLEQNKEVVDKMNQRILLNLIV